MSPKCQWHHRARQHLLHQTAAAAPRADSPAPPPPAPFPRDDGSHAVVTAAAAHTQAAVPRRRPHWRRRGTRSAATRQATHAAGRRQRVRSATRGTKRRLPRRAPTRPRPPPSAHVMAGATPWSPLWRRRHRRRCHGGARTGRGGARASLPRRAPDARAVCGLTCNRTLGSGRRLPHRPLTRAAPPPFPAGHLTANPAHDYWLTAVGSAGAAQCGSAAAAATADRCLAYSALDIRWPLTWGAGRPPLPSISTHPRAQCLAQVGRGFQNFWPGCKRGSRPIGIEDSRSCPRIAVGLSGCVQGYARCVQPAACLACRAAAPRAPRPDPCGRAAACLCAAAAATTAWRPPSRGQGEGAGARDSWHAARRPPSRAAGAVARAAANGVPVRPAAWRGAVGAAHPPQPLQSAGRRGTAACVCSAATATAVWRPSSWGPVKEG